MSAQVFFPFYISLFSFFLFSFKLWLYSSTVQREIWFGYCTVEGYVCFEEMGNDTMDDLNGLPRHPIGLKMLEDRGGSLKLYVEEVEGKIVLEHLRALMRDLHQDLSALSTRGCSAAFAEIKINLGEE